jgi:serine/threonine protein kinase
MFPKNELPRALEGFEILQRLGGGGVGQVFLAKSKGGKLVAIKVLSEEAHDAQVSAALTHEASLCARLNHEAIVQVRRLIQTDDFSALVFEYVKGVALVRLLRFAAGRGVRLPDAPAFHILERVLAALAFAHSQKDGEAAAPIVHRDVSPANVLVGWDGDVKLTDFGMAKMLGVTPTTTRVGLVKGTLGCMAPEQARGEAVNERADVYAVALLAWRLVTGRTPFSKYKDDESELLRAMRNPRLRPLSVMRPDLPAPLQEAFTAALEPDPAKRTIRADELLKVVRAVTDGAGGKSELVLLLDRWRAPLEKTVQRWQSSPDPDEAPPSGLDPEGHTTRYEEVALAFGEDSPSANPILDSSLPSDASLVPTTAHESVSRMGAAVPGALTMPPLPPMRITPPPLHTAAGGAILALDEPAKTKLQGGTAALMVLVWGAVLLAGGVALFLWLLG